MGISNSKNIDDNFFNEDIIVADSENIKTENFDFKKQRILILKKMRLLM